MKNQLLLLFTIIALTVAPQLQARSYYQYPSYSSYGQYNANFIQQSPAELLAVGVQYIQEYLKNSPDTDKTEIYAFLDAQISPFFDFDQMSQWVAGYHYNLMNSAQKYIFQTKLKKLFFNSFSRIVSAYGDAQPRIRFLPPRKRGYDEVIVSARIYPSKGYTIRVDFRFLKGPRGWKIYDVGTNGNSAVSYFRSYFNNIVRTHGVHELLK
ncbi:MAG: ABC transporter substrate-binding protein [Gammaproteobacteria bacterium]|nr:ABC transporter substrate-binding protein [Gammaproteobacteria bacterium]